MAWFVKSRELAQKRAEHMLSVEGLARKAGMSARRLRQLEAEDSRVQLATLQALAKALDTTPNAIGRAVLHETKVKLTAFASSANANGVAANVRPRLSDIVDTESKLPARPAVTVRGEKLPPFTARAYQQCFTAYGVHVDERYIVEGFVEDERGLPPVEAALLGDGAKSGVAARFLVEWTIGGAVLGVTVHAKDADHVRALQAANKTRKLVKAVVRVIAPEPIPDGGGLASFTRERPGPWGLLVEEVLDAERERSKPNGTRRRLPRSERLAPNSEAE